MIVISYRWTPFKGYTPCTTDRSTPFWNNTQQTAPPSLLPKQPRPAYRPSNASLPETPYTRRHQPDLSGRTRVLVVLQPRFIRRLPHPQLRRKLAGIPARRRWTSVPNRTVQKVVWKPLRRSRHLFRRSPKRIQPPHPASVQPTPSRHPPQRYRPAPRHRPTAVLEAKPKRAAHRVWIWKPQPTRMQPRRSPSRIQAETEHRSTF